MSNKAKTKFIISKVFYLATKVLVQSGQFRLQWRHLCFLLKVRREASGDTNFEPRFQEGVEARQVLRNGIIPHNFHNYGKMNRKHFLQIVEFDRCFRLFKIVFGEMSHL